MGEWRAKGRAASVPNVAKGATDAVQIGHAINRHDGPWGVGRTIQHE
jgi:hypothetical protein